MFIYNRKKESSFQLRRTILRFRFRYVFQKKRKENETINVQITAWMLQAYFRFPRMCTLLLSVQRTFSWEKKLQPCRAPVRNIQRVVLNQSMTVHAQSFLKASNKLLALNNHALNRLLFHNKLILKSFAWNCFFWVFLHGYLKVGGMWLCAAGREISSNHIWSFKTRKVPDW